jgi:hypothetical protein
MPDRKLCNLDGEHQCIMQTIVHLEIENVNVFRGSTKSALAVYHESKKGIDSRSCTYAALSAACFGAC